MGQKNYSLSNSGHKQSPLTEGQLGYRKEMSMISQKLRELS